MKLVECLDDPLFEFPKRVGDLSLREYLAVQFKRHSEILKCISESHIAADIAPHLANIRYAADAILETVDYYLRGHLRTASTHFEKAMTVFKPFLLMDKNGGMPKEFLLSRPYFRARSGKQKFTKGEMFHMPFSKRASVSTNRFSIPGLPCLYLSNCIYTCWEELNRPDFNSLQVSRFSQVDLDLKILNLSLTPGRIQKQLVSFPSSRFDPSQPYHEMSISLLVNWPLITACALFVSEPNAPFKQEYIIPQLLMQWIMEQSDVDGIQYFSNKSYSYSRNDFTKFINYVFPPKKMDRFEYCEKLCDSFVLTEAITFEKIRLKDPAENYMGNINSRVALENQDIEYLQGIREPYETTDFGKMEKYMLSMVPAAIYPQDYARFFPDDIDSDGNAHIEGEDGKTYDVHIDSDQ